MKTMISFASSLFVSALLLATPVQASSVCCGEEDQPIPHQDPIERLIGTENLRMVGDEQLTFIASDSMIQAQLLTRWPGFVKDFGFTSPDEHFNTLVNRKHDIITQDVTPDSELMFDARIWAQPRRASAVELAPFFNDYMTVWSISDGEHAGGFLFSWENVLSRGQSSIHDFSVVVSGIQLYTPPIGNLAEVPVPAAVWLFGSGLIGLAGFLRRRSL